MLKMLTPWKESYDQPRQHIKKQRHYFARASLVAEMVKCLSAMWETQVRSLGREDPWRRKWQPTPIFVPGKFCGLRSLVDYSQQGHKASDTTE